MSPSELLFGRPLHTQVPLLDDKVYLTLEVREYEKSCKERMKEYNDRRRYAKESMMKIGDKVIVRQRKTTTKPFYDPIPYTVTEKKGSMVTATRTNKRITRDVSKFKMIKERPVQIQQNRQPISDSDDEDYDTLFQSIRHGRETVEEEIEYDDESVMSSNNEEEDEISDYSDTVPYREVE